MKVDAVTAQRSTLRSGTTGNGLGPIAVSERVPILDSLRGFAIMGILVVNIVCFANPVLNAQGGEPEQWYDLLAQGIEKVLFENKFYTIFSFLFGVGLCLQLARAEARGQRTRAFYHRRLWVLLGMGIVHAVLWWPGEILRLYAVLGFALLVFYHRRTRTILIWAGISAVLLSVLAVVLLLCLAAAAGWTDESMVFAGIDLGSYSQEAYNSSWPWAVVGYQLTILPLNTLSLFANQGGMALAMALLGVAIGRTTLLREVTSHQRLLRRVFLITLPVGLATSALALSDTVPVAFLSLLFAPVLATAYVTGIALLSLTAGGQRVLRPLGNVGRMALTNYLVQSIVCSILFNGYGCGLSDQVSQAALLGMAILIFLIQIPASGWWLSRYQFGPLEWVLRSATYWRRQPMR